MRLVKAIETPGTNTAATTSALLIAQQVAGKAARDALFLSSFPAAHLPAAMAAGAVLSFAAVYWLSVVMVRRSPATLLPILLAVSALGYALEWLLSYSAPSATALAVYFHTALFGPVLLSTFWSMINERFDPHAAKAAVARIAGGGTLGGVLGGVAVWRASTMVKPVEVLLLLGTLNLLALAGAIVTRARKDVATSEAEAANQRSAEVISPLGTLRAEPFLRNLALLVALGTATSAILDYIFSSQAVAAFGKGQALLSFFSLFWLAVGVLSFVLQVAFGRVALEKLGLAVSIAVMPGLIILGGAFGMAVPGLVSASLLRGAEAVQRNTLFRSAYELLYTPLAEQSKRATKVLIDVGFDRLGTVIGSGIALFALWAFTHTSSSFLLGAVVALALATLPVARGLHAGYVQALQQGLQDGAAKLEEDAAQERHSTGWRHTGVPERERLIQRIEEMHPGGLTALLESNGEGVKDAAAVSAAESLAASEQLLEAVRDLLSSNLEKARLALSRLQAGGPEVACAILLLAHRDLHGDALKGLQNIAPGITGQLIDALLDPRVDFDMRRRIPRVMRKSGSQRAAEGLLLGLNDARFEVRYECGRALLVLTRDNAQIVISQEKAIEAIEREVTDEKRILNNVAGQFDDDASDNGRQSLVDGLVRDRVDRTLEHIFTILCLHLDREPLRMAFRALHHEDTKYRGTALEYLNTVLPPQIRDLVWPFLGQTTPLRSARAASDLLAELTLAG